MTQANFPGRTPGGSWRDLFKHHSVLSLFTLMAIMVPGVSFAQDEISALADQLIQMRGEVDALQSELNVKREEHKNRMAYLTAQRADLEASRDREALRVRQLEEDLEDMRLKVAAAAKRPKSSHRSLWPISKRFHKVFKVAPRSRLASDRQPWTK